VYFYDNLVVLKTATVPAVLLEAGVIVNRDEERDLASAARRALTADAVLQGLQQCGVAIVP
jgi:N-acetylmuramoyl-L-alanine amidase